MVGDAAESPRVVLLAGPNGAGKSTVAPRLLRGALRVPEFVNADTIALGLSGWSPASVAFEAGAIMLSRLHALGERNASFAFETTLASRSFAPWLRQLVGRGYEVHVVFLWLSSPEMAIDRVATRVRQGGHDVPEATIRRRYWAGLRNFFNLYQPLATSWQLVDNRFSRTSLIASGCGKSTIKIAKPVLWNLIAPSLEP